MSETKQTHLPAAIRWRDNAIASLNLTVTNLQAHLQSLQEKLAGFQSFCEIHREFNDPDISGCPWCFALEAKANLIVRWAEDKALLNLYRGFVNDMRYVDKHIYANISPNARALIEKGEWPE
jgi:hypothetical protein